MRLPYPLRRARRRRFAVVTAVAAALLIAAVLGCGDNTVYITDCGTPTLDEKAADGGPDPCHCDPPPSANFGACGCLSNPIDQQSMDEYQTCMFLYHAEQDAGGGGGGGH